ncbi:MAG: 3-deoxy-D-manno-octulosonic acid transferase [Acidithiobacillus caldus]|nr:3-deoxy-D-manno-octulosonic acid transferase [Acidithiobacillus caldus]
MMARLYWLLTILLTPLVWLYTLWKLWRRPAYRDRWRERFGWIPRRSGRRPIWVHAVSVGESMAALPLLRALRERYPEQPLVVTSTTPTGAATIRRHLGREVTNFYLPYDLPGAVGRFLRRQDPCAGIFLETEIWPNLYRVARRRQIPMALLNARLSASSQRGYGRFRGLFAPLLRDLPIAAQTDRDAAAFARLGAERVAVLGQIKTDLPDPQAARAAGQAWHLQLGGRPLWVFASTHVGEEALALGVLKELWADFPDLLLVLIPRHPERGDAVCAEIRAAGCPCRRRSRAETPQVGERAIFLIDTLGEVLDFYAAADVVTIGGSFVAVGGHNPIEAAILGRAPIFGPHMDNFAAVAEALVAARAAFPVAGAQDLRTQIAALLREPQLRAEAGERAASWLRSQRGALAATLEWLAQEQVLPVPAAIRPAATGGPMPAADGRDRPPEAGADSQN